MQDYATNYNANANLDDNSCECGPNALMVNMFDSYGDGWNGNGFAIVDASDNVIGTGTLPSPGSSGSAMVCLADADGVYSIYVGDGVVAAEGSAA